MAGGVGSRFWPISRAKQPKQFLDILRTGKTLLQQTFERYEYFCSTENIYIVTSKEYAQITREQLPHISNNQILLEPVRRNTAPCIAYANEKIYCKNPNANVIVAPSDHIILNEDKFRNVINKGLDFTAKSDNLVTIGLKPTRPDTGYGYIQFDEEIQGIKSVHKVKTFTEKPNIDLAKMFVDSGEFLWNSGIFMWKLSTIKKSFATHLPDIATVFSEISQYYNTDKETEQIERVYATCKNISIDYGVMEKARNVYVVAADFGWSDLGTWGSLFEYLPKNNDNNTGVTQNILAYETKNCMIDISSNKIAVIQGLRDFIVAESGDLLLICKKSDEQNLRNIVNDIRKNFGEEAV